MGIENLKGGINCCNVVTQVIVCGLSLLRALQMRHYYPYPCAGTHYILCSTNRVSYSRIQMKF